MHAFFEMEDQYDLHLIQDRSFYPLFSIKTSEFADDSKLPLIAELIWNLDQLSQNNIEQTRHAIPLL